MRHDLRHRERRHRDAGRGRGGSGPLPQFLREQHHLDRDRGIAVAGLVDVGAGKRARDDDEFCAGVDDIGHVHNARTDHGESNRDGRVLVCH
jgi:hypothetical protein